ncbi:MAG: OmpA family protein [Myxococcota bacterium]
MKHVVTLVLALSVAGCGAKKIQSNLDTCNAELGACQAALAEAKKAPTTTPFVDDRLDAYRQLAKQFKDAFGADDITIVLREGRMVVQLPNQVLFDSGKVVLKDSGKETLDKVAGILENNTSRRFLIAGHTDDVAVKAGARFEDNWELSALRATTAAKYLQSKGVPPTQIGAAGFGQYLPAVANDTDANKAKNRRLEVIVFPTIDEMPKFPAKL